MHTSDINIVETSQLLSELNTKFEALRKQLKRELVGPRLVSDYKQLIVTLLTKVFMHDFPMLKATRISNEKLVYGMFVDLIREAGRPLLLLAIPETHKSFERHARFSRQIQYAIKLAKRKRVMNN
jgi:hypothetical protein